MALRVEKNVIRLDIAMNNGLAVQMTKTLACLNPYSQRLSHPL